MKRTFMILCPLCPLGVEFLHPLPHWAKTDVPVHALPCIVGTIDFPSLVSLLW